MKLCLASAGVALVVALTAACASAPQQIAHNPPAMDLSDPLKAVQSWWALSDWEEAYFREMASYSAEEFAIGKFGNAYDKALGAVLGDGIGGRLRDSRQCKDDCLAQRALSRTVTNIRKVSPERVIIEATIRNVTPIPPSVSLDENDTLQREFGKPTRYVVDNVDGVWRIVRISHKPAPSGYVDENGVFTRFDEQEDYVEDLTEESLKPSPFEFTYTSGY